MMCAVKYETKRFFWRLLMYAYGTSVRSILKILELREKHLSASFDVKCQFEMYISSANCIRYDDSTPVTDMHTKIKSVKVAPQSSYSPCFCQNRSEGGGNWSHKICTFRLVWEFSRGQARLRFHNTLLSIQLVAKNTSFAKRVVFVNRWFFFKSVFSV